MEMSKDKLRKAKSYLFIAGGLFAAGLGIYFSKTGFGFELPGLEWIGWGLGVLCIIVQIAFSSQLAYKSYNYVIFFCGVLAYLYSGWSNYYGIMSLNAHMDWRFALFLAEFIDWIAEPLIVFGLIGVSDDAEGDFLRNLFGIKAKIDGGSKNTSKPSSGGNSKPSLAFFDEADEGYPKKPYTPNSSIAKKRYGK